MTENNNDLNHLYGLFTQLRKKLSAFLYGIPQQNIKETKCTLQPSFKKTQCSAFIKPKQ